MTERVQLRLKQKYLVAPKSRYRSNHNDGVKKRIRHKAGRKSWDTWSPEAVLVLVDARRRRFERL